MQFTSLSTMRLSSKQCIAVKYNSIQATKFDALQNKQLQSNVIQWNGVVRNASQFYTIQRNSINRAHVNASQSKLLKFDAI